MSKTPLQEIKKIIRYTVKQIFESRDAIAEQPSIEKQVYDEIEMRMRPTDSRLSTDEIIEIANEYNLEPEQVAQIMVNYTAKRDKEKESDLTELVKDIILHDFNGQAPDFKTFYRRFLDYDESLDYGTERIAPVQNIFNALTKDPNQLTMDLQEKTKSSKKKKEVKPQWIKNQEPCPVCQDTTVYIGPETGGWKSCAKCGTI